MSRVPAMTGGVVRANVSEFRAVGIIPTALSGDRYCCPRALGEGSDSFRHPHELVPGLAAGLDNSLVAWPHLVAEPVLTHVFPDVFECIVILPFYVGFL